MERTIQIDVHQSDWVNLLGTLWYRHFHDSVMCHVVGMMEHGLFVGLTSEVHVAGAAGVRILS